MVKSQADEPVFTVDLLVFDQTKASHIFGLLKKLMIPCLSMVSDVLILYFHNKLVRFNNLFKTGDRETALISSHSLTQFPSFVDVNFHCGDK